MHKPTYRIEMRTVAPSPAAQLVTAHEDRERALAVFGSFVSADAESEHDLAPDGGLRLVLVATGPATDSVSAVNRPPTGFTLVDGGPPQHICINLLSTGCTNEPESDEGFCASCRAAGAGEAWGSLEVSR